MICFWGRYSGSSACFPPVVRVNIDIFLSMLLCDDKYLILACMRASSHAIFEWLNSCFRLLLWSMNGMLSSVDINGFWCWHISIFHKIAKFYSIVHSRGIVFIVNTPTAIRFHSKKKEYSHKRTIGSNFCNLFVFCAGCLWFTLVTFFFIRMTILCIYVEVPCSTWQNQENCLTY
jgi:hypothetical protein